MRAGGAQRMALLAVVPFLVAATDPEGDVVGCSGGAGSGAPDLVAVRGEIVELGTSARWKLTFAEPLVVPDTEGRPFRVDIAIYDPGMPAMSFGYYLNVNRLVRVDATIEHRTEIYLLPERGSNVFNPPIIEGRSMTIQVPGRTLSEDEDLTGTSPGLEDLRWTVIVRDERACDFLGDGRPRERLIPQRDAQVAQHHPPSERSPWWRVGSVTALLSIGAIATYRFVRARGSAH
ncbi:MAG TPA: hypothetical protein VMR89_08685 [Actinomycetota bacterium]|nr:hypothetical protein [Actinomycetota bacterium]